MRKKVVVILLTVLVLFSACILGVSTVYRIDEVTLKVQGVSDSEAARREEETLRETLLKAYKGDSILFSKQKKAEKILVQYPCFRLTDFEKKSPNRIVVKVTEEAEVYAVEKGENGYYILSADGTTLCERDTPQNRVDGENNLIIKGFSVSANRGEQPSSDPAFTHALAFCRELSALFNGIRKNVLSLERVEKTPDGTDIPVTMLCFTMREGVKIYISQPETLTKEKAQAAVEKYFSLSVTERTKGAITLLETATAIYEEKDPFA